MTATADMVAELRRMVDEPNNDPYTDDERLRIASEKKIVSEENMGGGSGMGFFDESNLVQNTIIIAIIGVGFAIGLTYYSKKIK